MTMSISRKARIKDAVGVLIFILVLAGGAHFWITDRLAVWRMLYPVQAAITQSMVRCSAGAPGWMFSSIHHAISHQSSLSNQLSYITPAGQIHHCESGWQGRMLMSPRINNDTRFRYASMTKLLTADAVLREVDKGNLALDETLDKLLPEVFPAADVRLVSIRVRDLLDHSAGFDRLKTQDTMSAHNKKPWCPYDLSVLSKMTLDFTPGEKQVYSNLGYCLLGIILERKTQNNYRDWIKEQYSLNESNIRFVDGEYYPDEVSYDFRNSNFYGENYSRYFDFYALSSSAGLSGSATALAESIKTKLMGHKLNVTSAVDAGYCEPARLSGCFGYGPSRYQAVNNKLSVHVQQGFLYGMSSTALIDDQGGVTVWLGNGMSLNQSAGDGMSTYLYSALSSFYQ